MKRTYRSPFDAHLPSGWLLRVGLVVLAGMLASSAAGANQVSRVALASVDRASAALASEGLGSPGDENWTAGFGSGDLDAVHALAIDADGNLYAGGRGIARWDGSTWSSLGLPWTGRDVIVTCLTVDGVGNLYAGGDDRGIVGEAALLAKWDGSSWSILDGIGSGSYVYALAADGSGNLYVGGDFDDAGGVAAKNIAKWNGSSWSALGAGVERVGDAMVLALVIDGSGNLYAGGSFFTAGELAANNVAKWDGSSWSSLGGETEVPRALAMDELGNLYAGGWFDLAKWDGSSWSFLLNLASWRGIEALALDNGGNLYVGGDDLRIVDGLAVHNIAKWDGSSWSALGSGVNGRIRALAAGRAGSLYAGGDFTTAGNNTSPFTAHWTAADGQAISGPGTYTFYAHDLPVTVVVPAGGQGELARINMQRFNTNYPNALVPLRTGYYWQIEGLNASRGIASGYSVNLTLPVPGFTPDENARMCRRHGLGMIWYCAATSYTADTITRNGVAQLSDWAVSKTMIWLLCLPLVRR